MIGLTFSIQGFSLHLIQRYTIFLKKQTKSQRNIKIWSYPTPEGLIRLVVRGETLIFGKEEFLAGSLGTPGHSVELREGLGIYLLYRGFSGLPGSSWAWFWTP